MNTVVSNTKANMRMSRAARWGGMFFLWLLLPGSALAQFTNWNDMGGSIWDQICGFIDSPIVAGVLAISLIVALLAFTANEGNRLISTVLGVIIGAATIMFIPSLIIQLGFGSSISC